MRNISAVLLEYTTQKINSAFSIVHTRCTYMGSMEFEHQRGEDERWAGKQQKWGGSHSGQHIPNSTGVLESED
jgi:hypothetical protein